MIFLSRIAFHNDMAHMETEQPMVEGNRELIRIYEEKVKKVIEKVWEG